MSRSSRRGFLRDLVTGFGAIPEALREGRREDVCRPPGAARPEARFLELCTAPSDGCRRCVDVCPELCIVPAQAGVQGHPRPGTPFLIPHRAACTLCGLCQPACPTGALAPVQPAQARIGEAVVDLDRCRGGRPDGCRACVDACPFPDLAIRMLAGGDPEVILEACTGCGLCAVACPADAIEIRPLCRGD